MRGRCFFCTYLREWVRIGRYGSLWTAKHYGKYISHSVARGPLPVPADPTHPIEGTARCRTPLRPPSVIRRSCHRRQQCCVPATDGNDDQPLTA
jgi:hypothetical protein